MSDPLHESSKRVETLLERFSAFPATTGARADAEELVRIISSLYGECLRRIARTYSMEACCDDPLVASLLITHGLHPVPLEQRVRTALKGVDGVEPISISEDLVELRIDGPEEVVARAQAAVYAAAPEVLNVRASGQTISLLGAL